MTCVLVVDDEPAVAMMLEKVLRHYGFSVLTAGSGEEAVKLYSHSHGGIGVVLLDVQMPGMDGPATLEALWQINPQVVSCFMSGNMGEYTLERLFGFGARHVFLKPFLSISKLVDLIRDCFP
jgi:CheY-like chemotaxis protein